MENVVTGLSYSHIRSQNAVLGVQNAKVEYYKDGNLAKVTRELAVKTCVECGESFKVAAWRKNYVTVCRSCRGLTGHTRGVVSRFSENSRRRLMRTLAKLHKDVRPVFVTLTYPDSYEGYADPDVWKRDLRAFEHRFRRAFPAAAYIWRLEVIDRKSGEHVGELFPHFHLLVFGVSHQKLRHFVPTAWFEVVGTGDGKHLAAGTQVKPILSRRGIMSYASKRVGLVMSGELAKVVQANGRSVGRWWGVAFRVNFERFLSEVDEIELTDGESVHILRYFRKLTGAFSRAYRSLTVFISGGWFGKNLAKMAVPLTNAVRSFKVTGRRIDTPFWEWAYYSGRLKPELET